LHISAISGTLSSSDSLFQYNLVSPIPGCITLNLILISFPLIPSYPGYLIISGLNLIYLPSIEALSLASLLIERAPVTIMSNLLLYYLCFSFYLISSSFFFNSSSISLYLCINSYSLYENCSFSWFYLSFSISSSFLRSS
jgi:hypothetical protein